MTLKNRYVKRAEASEATFRLLIRYFFNDFEAKTIAFLTGLNRNTVNRYLTLIRKRIAEFCEQRSPVQGEIEVDESYSHGIYGATIVRRDLVDAGISFGKNRVARIMRKASIRSCVKTKFKATTQPTQSTILR